MHTPAELKAEILRLTRDYSNLVHQANWPAPVREMEFEPGETVIPYAGRVFTADEVEAAVGSALDFWLTLGPEGEAFERELSHYLGVRHTLLVNSGSSANLVALSALTTHKLSKERRILPGDEVITVAAGFPTTVAPIIQNSAVAVFVDNDPCTGNIRVDQLELAYREGKTKAVMMAHALGNPFDIGAVLAFCRRYNLWLIEDNCDALGSTYTMPEAEARTLELDHLLAHATSGTHPNIYFETTPTGERLLTAPTGSWGDLSTQSFYPPHHITMGEGGAVNIVSKAALKSYAESFRDWGRDCWCASGKDDSCKRRFGWQLGELPKGYDHKYVYSHLGYNLKPLDLQAAIGRQQLKRLPEFINLRKANWQRLRDGLANLEEFFEFSLPCHAVAWQKENIKDPSAKLPNFAWAFDNKRVECSWFGFMLRVKSSAPFSHTDLAQHLSREKIGSRMFFGGNLLRQPIFIQMKKSRPDAFRAVVDCKGADLIMNSAIFLGTYPGLSSKMIDYEINKITQFAKHK
jgi:CDP-6-deoxy-D-xylo-4-hexulose-3-dehydrase